MNFVGSTRSRRLCEQIGSRFREDDVMRGSFLILYCDTDTFSMKYSVSPKQALGTPLCCA
jgi:RimJ/RimL family protein N-acetyltransferase